MGEAVEAEDEDAPGLELLPVRSDEDLAKAQVSYNHKAVIWHIRHSGKKLSAVTVGGAQNYKALAERIARLMWLRWDEGTPTKDELAEYRVSLVKMISGVPRREKSTEQVMETARRDERRKRTLETQNSMSDLE